MAIMANTRYDTEKKYKRADGDPATPAATTLVVPSLSSWISSHLSFVLIGAAIAGILIWKAKKRK
jgi:hypothetical protein